MAAKGLNIEVGERIVKVCVSEKRNKSYQISDCFLFQTPSGAVRDGQIVDVEAMAEALRADLGAHGASGIKNVTFTLTSTKVPSREVMLPLMKDNRIKSAVETNASDYFPVDMSAYSVAHSLLERREGDNPGCRVQVTAAPRTLLESYARLADAAGLQLEAVDYCGNSQYQVLRNRRDQGVVMYVDVNVSNTFVSFMKDGVLLLQRNINIGGDELISAVMNEAGRDESEFLATLQQAEDREFLDSVLSRDRQEEELSRLVSGISRSESFFKSGHSETPAVKAVLMGICSNIAGLKEQVQDEIGLETVALTDVEGIRFAANAVGGVSSCISCVGSLVAPLELLPEDLRAQKKKRRKMKKEETLTLGIAVCTALVLLGAALAGLSVNRYFSALKEQEKLERRLKELAYVQETVDVCEAYQTTEAALREIRAYSGRHNASLVKFFEEMERKMPSAMLLQSAVCDEQGVTMNIVTPDMKEADVVISRLRSFESVKQIEVSTITEDVDEGGVPSAAFSVKCSYEEEPGEEELAEEKPTEKAGTAEQGEQKE